MTAADVSTVEASDGLVGVAPDGVGVRDGAADAGGRSDGAADGDGAGDAMGGEEALAGLRRQARHLIAELTGPVRRIRLRSGPAVLEVEWHPEDLPRPAAPATPVEVARPVVPAPNPPTAVLRAPTPGRAAVRAPIVGTFYRSPEPGARPFVAVGDLVRPGQPIAIVEAMKLMNEVTADRAGRVVAILVEDGQPVEYDQPLVELDPA
ncbi:acetyl-CoA carboxylase biotin carboxyl carrier protein [Micromonospora sp. WMMD1120]|uniref:acetyl-CoA carboxylase biotin carboxyl carrier protein n=1 Tax=Micromonospora sp. WMMD1120 TaxID=3016106 RepID=UPI0024177519|nr:acetyl-CoA carboxylase biotin carboxyl carrier protein [Micromonospora sp. WMMD1120]MDG4810280.1 acetyl-CoA carboxylase biotin carboxyl carrier protein [Micromonospora sp. WMMD1120]